MRTITKEINVYKFWELPENIQETLIEKERKNILNGGIFLSMFEEETKNVLENEYGFENVNIRYSLNHSQGDGFSFSADNYKGLKGIFNEVCFGDKEKVNFLMEETALKIIGNTGRYAFADKSDIDLYIDSDLGTEIDDYYKPYIRESLEKLQNLYMSLCKKFEERGYFEIDHQLSDEVIREKLESDYEFTIDGEIYEDYF